MVYPSFYCSFAANILSTPVVKVPADQPDAVLHGRQYLNNKT